MLSGAMRHGFIRNDTGQGVYRSCNRPAARPKQSPPEQLTVTWKLCRDHLAGCGPPGASAPSKSADTDCKKGGFPPPFARGQALRGNDSALVEGCHPRESGVHGSRTLSSDFDGTLPFCGIDGQLLCSFGSAEVWSLAAGHGAL